MMFSPQWPVTLSHEDLTLRPLARRDKKQWYAVREANAAWLKQWEATSPDQANVVHPFTFSGLIRLLNKEAREGHSLPFVMEYQGKFIGQIKVANIHYGSAYSASIGYWIAQEYAGCGLTPLGVAMAIDYCFFNLNLHRVEIHVRPENTRSLRVIEKLSFREEGYRPAYLHVNGAWADHRSFALLAEEVPQGLVAKIINLSR